MANDDLSSKLDADILFAFSKPATNIGRIDMLIDAIALIGDGGLGKQLADLYDQRNAPRPAPGQTEVQAARDAQQAALDAEAAQPPGYDLKGVIPEDPRDAQIDPVTTEGESADRIHGREGSLTGNDVAAEEADTVDEGDKDVVALS